MSTNFWAPYDVYLGTWTDWSRGKVFGAIVTLTRQDSRLLIAFLAFYVALVGTRLWSILSLVLRWTFSNQDSHPQRQTFLHNTPKPESALWTLTSISRVLWLIVLAFASFVSSHLAGGYLVSHEALLSGTNCAFIGNNPNASTWGVTVGPMISQAITAAENYARQCYTFTPSSVPGSTSCSSMYVRKQVPPAILDTNASCPFDPRLCKSPNKNLLIDTGLLDSFHDFGRNSPNTQRLKVRRTLHCAPLVTEGYRLHSFDQTRNKSYTAYHYGPLRNADKTVTEKYTARFSSNFNTDTDQILQGAGDSTHDFALRLHYAIFVDQHRHPMSTFHPIPEIVPRNSSGNLLIVFLQSDILFVQKPNDTWYGDDLAALHVPHLLKAFNGTQNVTMFRQNTPGSPLACHELEQYCYTGRKGIQKCNQLQGGPDAVGYLFDALLDKEGEEWLDWFELTTVETSLMTTSALNLLGMRMLRAKDNLNGPVLGGRLPDNQWQLDVLHWHATAMADIQAAFLRSVVGPGNKDLERLMRVYCANTTVQREICGNQRVVVEGFVSLNLFAIICIFIGGLLIIISSFTLHSWHLYRHRGEHNVQYSRLEECQTDESLRWPVVDGHDGSNEGRRSDDMPVDEGKEKRVGLGKSGKENV